MGELFWDLAYISGFTPWDTKEPPEEIIEYLNIREKLNLAECWI
jgi:hypothetical protein